MVPCFGNSGQKGRGGGGCGSGIRATSKLLCKILRGRSEGHLQGRVGAVGWEQGAVRGLRGQELHTGSEGFWQRQGARRCRVPPGHHQDEGTRGQ